MTSTTEFSKESSTGDQIRDAAQDIRAKVADAATTAKQKASDAGRQATEQVDAKRGPAADALKSTASTIHEQAENLPGGEAVKNVAHSAAEKLESTAGYIREHGLKAMISDLEDMVRRNPGPALLIAASVGFLIGRAFRED